MKKTKFLLIFIPSIENGGVEKNLYLIANYFAKNNITINGQSLSEIGTYRLKNDYYFFMGDNRDSSYDSRFWGFVPFNHILGEALFVYFSLDLETWFPRLNRIATVLK